MKCKCTSCGRILSNAVQNISAGKLPCCDTGSGTIGVYCPLIYDEIGINLCATFPVGVNVPAEYPTACSARISVLNISIPEGDAPITPVTGCPGCFTVTLTDLTVSFAVEVFDACNRLLGTQYPAAVYLPSDTTAPTYDEDTNPATAQLSLYAPYGTAYNTTGPASTPALNLVGMSQTVNTIRQGINLFAIPKLLAFDVTDSELTAGITLVLQSLYFGGYQLTGEGRRSIPKGSIIDPEETDCLKFVAGDLLDLEIRPLNLTASENCCNNTMQ